VHLFLKCPVFSKNENLYFLTKKIIFAKVRSVFSFRMNENPDRRREIREEESHVGDIRGILEIITNIRMFLVSREKSFCNVVNRLNDSEISEHVREVVSTYFLSQSHFFEGFIEAHRSNFLELLRNPEQSNIHNLSSQELHQIFFVLYGEKREDSESK